MHSLDTQEIQKQIRTELSQAQPMSGLQPKKGLKNQEGRQIYIKVADGIFQLDIVALTVKPFLNSRMGKVKSRELSPVPSNLTTIHGKV